MIDPRKLDADGAISDPLACVEDSRIGSPPESFDGSRLSDPLACVEDGRMTERLESVEDSRPTDPPESAENR